jgi:hypothetical protein
MRSLYTIALIVLIGLASYDNAHAQGQNPPGTGLALGPNGQVVVGPNGQFATLPWCLPLSNIPDPTGGTDGLGDQQGAGCLSTPSPAPSGSCVVNPPDVINQINMARKNENMQRQNAMLPLMPYITGEVNNALPTGTTTTITAPSGANQPQAMTNAPTDAGGSQLVFASSSPPAGLYPFIAQGNAVVTDSQGAIPSGTKVVEAYDNWVMISPPLPSTGSGVASGDTITFTQPLPDNYSTLTDNQKLVVLINLERQARGLSLFPTLTVYSNSQSGSGNTLYGDVPLSWEAQNHALVLAEFYQFQQLSYDGTSLVHENAIDGDGETNGTNNSMVTVLNRIEAIPGFSTTMGSTTVGPQPNIEAETDVQNPEAAVFTLLYQDADSGWGHRHGLLGVNQVQAVTNAAGADMMLSFMSAPTGITNAVVTDSQGAIPPGTTVISSTDNTVTVSKNVTGVASGDTIIFTPPSPGPDDHCTTLIGAGSAQSANEGTIELQIFNNEVTEYNNYVSQYNNQQPPPETPLTPATPLTVAPTTFFYVVDLVGQEEGVPGAQPVLLIGPAETPTDYPTPAPLGPITVANQAGVVSVSVTYPNPAFGLTNSIPSVYVYPNPQWWVCPPAPANCTSPMLLDGQGPLGGPMGIPCAQTSMTMGTSSSTYNCATSASSASALANKSVVVIARDAFDQFVCQQPPATSLTPQLTDICGVPSP